MANGESELMGNNPSGRRLKLWISSITGSKNAAVLPVPLSCKVYSNYLGKVWSYRFESEQVNRLKLFQLFLYKFDLKNCQWQTFGFFDYGDYSLLNLSGLLIVLGLQISEDFFWKAVIKIAKKIMQYKNLARILHIKVLFYPYIQT